MQNLQKISPAVENGKNNSDSVVVKNATTESD